MRRKILIKGTLILTFTGIATRLIGFFYRIFLSRSFGETAVGLYQLIFLSMHLQFHSQVLVSKPLFPDRLHVNTHFSEIKNAPAFFTLG